LRRCVLQNPNSQKGQELGALPRGNLSRWI
jgi:hypothetical protein